MKFCTWIAHGKPVEHHIQQKCEISTDVIDNDVVMFKFERFVENAQL